MTLPWRLYGKTYEIVFRKYPTAPVETIHRDGCNEADVTLGYKFADPITKNQIEFISVTRIA